tara:strand:- start:1058 stop:1324 length:267 start_codon:yes stop_codon:yes gene_type:complete
MAIGNTARKLAHRLRLRRSLGRSNNGWRVLTSAIESKGDLKRWSLKNTAGGVIVTTACEQIVVHGITWQAVILCFVGVLPLLFSTLEK